MIFENIEQANERLAYWQAVLRLQDWKVAIEIARQRDMCNKDAGAEIDPSLPNKSALVRLLDPVDYVQEFTRPAQDHERNLVHELLHLHFEAVDVHVFNKDPELLELIRNDEEIGIELIAAALVLLDRRNRPSPANLPG